MKYTVYKSRFIRFFSGMICHTLHHNLLHNLSLLIVIIGPQRSSDQQVHFDRHVWAKLSIMRASLSDVLLVK